MLKVLEEYSIKAKTSYIVSNNALSNTATIKYLFK